MTDAERLVFKELQDKLAWFRDNYRERSLRDNQTDIVKQTFSALADGYSGAHELLKETLLRVEKL